MDKNLLDAAVAELQRHKTEWARLPLSNKISLLEELRRRLAEKGKDWVEISVKGKQIDPQSPMVGEEWTSGPWILARGINGYLNTLKAQARGQVLMPKKISTRSNGQVSARIFPNDIFDSLLMNGIQADVWMQPGVTESNLKENMAAVFREKNPLGMVSLILGAGNIAGIPPRDTLYRLFGLGHVVLLKLSPINEYLGPVFEEIFSAFIKSGYLRFAYGDGEVGNYLVHHAGVEEIHMTGASHTYESIMFGRGPEGTERKRRNQPLVKKPFTGELGGVTPVIVVPGKWSEADIRYQAENVVTMKLQNAGHNCVAGQVLVLSKTWDQRDQFLDEIRKLMRNLPPRIPYYPNTEERLNKMAAAYPAGERLGTGIPRLLITNLDPNKDNEACFQKEVFGPVLAQTNLPGNSAGEFLQNAADFCNKQLYGTLGANVIIHPKTLRQLGNVFEKFLTDLHFGSIGINIWNAAAFLLVEATWGAFPGHTPINIQSGIGTVGNSFLFEKPERSVVRGSFYPFPRTWLNGDPAFLPKPPWFVTNKTAHITSRLVTRITLDQRWRHIPLILLSAMLG